MAMNKIVCIVVVILAAATNNLASLNCILPNDYTWIRPPQTNISYTITKDQGSWFHMVFECARIGHPRTNIAYIKDQETIQILHNITNLDEGVPFWIGATQIGQSRDHWVWYKYRDINNKDVEKVTKFFWTGDVTKEERKASAGRKDCIRHDVQKNTWSTDTCGHYNYALCQIEC